MTHGAQVLRMRGGNRRRVASLPKGREGAGVRCGSGSSWSVTVAPLAAHFLTLLSVRLLKNLAMEAHLLPWTS